MSMQLADLGAQIRKHRKQKGWTQEQLAEKIGVSVTYLGYMERGERMPGLWTFLEILNCLDIAWEEVVITENSEKQKEWDKNRKLWEALPPEKQQMVMKVISVLLEELAE